MKISFNYKDKYKYKDSFDTVTPTANKSMGFDLSAINLVFFSLLLSSSGPSWAELYFQFCSTPVPVSNAVSGKWKMTLETQFPVMDKIELLYPLIWWTQSAFPPSTDVFDPLRLSQFCNFRQYQHFLAWRALILYIWLTVNI